jgi:hypothetical protein
MDDFELLQIQGGAQRIVLAVHQPRTMVGRAGRANAMVFEAKQQGAPAGDRDANQ